MAPFVRTRIAVVDGVVVSFTTMGGKECNPVVIGTPHPELDVAAVNAFLERIHNAR